MGYQPTITQSTQNGTSFHTDYGHVIGTWQQLTSTVDIGPCGPVGTPVDMDEIMEEIQKRMNMVPTMEHKCRNCGGALEMRADQHIFICPYCGSAYAVGTAQINDKGQKRQVNIIRYLINNI